MPQLVINSENEFSLNHLNPTQFEEFCFDLLECLGFKNVNWRKGTGQSSSPSDQGRDIECERITEDLDGEIVIEKWFVECKHYISGVPPDKIQGILSWANSKRPDKILIIASNFLSNPCKNYLDDYVRENRPPFKIKYWEKKDLERITQGQSLLLKKYEIGLDFSFINIMHPNHLIYIKELNFNTLDFFFKIMEDVETDMRDKILAFPYSFILKPRIRKPTNKNETWGDLLIDEISYDNFKAKCYELEKTHTNISIANYVTDIILKFYLDAGDITTLDQKINKFESIRYGLQNKLLMEERINNSLQRKLQVDENLKTCRDREEVIKSALDKLNSHIDTIPDQTKEYHLIYNFFCENVLSKLLQEEILRLYMRFSESS